jgi:hypothetical protein
MEATGKPEVVHTFGWYMRKYARDVKAKGATPIILSHIPRNNFVTKDSLQIVRNDKGSEPGAAKLLPGKKSLI